MTHTPPEPERKPDWRAHFDWLEKQKELSGGFVKELEEDRRQQARQTALEELLEILCRFQFRCPALRPFVP